MLRTFPSSEGVLVGVEKSKRRRLPASRVEHWAIRLGQLLADSSIPSYKQTMLLGGLRHLATAAARPAACIAAGLAIAQAPPPPVQCLRVEEDVKLDFKDARPRRRNTEKSLATKKIKKMAPHRC